MGEAWREETTWISGIFQFKFQGAVVEVRVKNKTFCDKEPKSETAVQGISSFSMSTNGFEI
jgi:hypothetical protein